MGKKKRARVAPPKRQKKSNLFTCPVCNTIESVSSEKHSKKGIFFLICKVCREKYTYKYGLLDTPNEAHKSWSSFIYKKKKYGVPCPGPSSGAQDCKCNFKGLAIIEFLTETDETDAKKSYAKIICPMCGVFMRPLYPNETKEEFKKRMARENAQRREERSQKLRDDDYDEGFVLTEETGDKYLSRKKHRRGTADEYEESGKSDIVMDDGQGIGSPLSEPESADDI